MRRWTPLIVLAATAYLLVLFARLDDRVVSPGHIVGLLIVVPSFAVWTVARYQLGDAFTARAEARRLVTHGLYATFRNPIYVFGELLWIGAVVFAGRPWMLVVTFVSIPIQVRRARREARILEERFGDRYRADRSRTRF